MDLAVKRRRAASLTRRKSKNSMIFLERRQVGLDLGWGLMPRNLVHGPVSSFVLKPQHKHLLPHSLQAIPQLISCGIPGSQSVDVRAESFESFKVVVYV